MSLTQKSYSFKLTENSDHSHSGHEFEGFASTFGNTDLVDDVVASGAFTKSIKRRMPKMLFQHNSGNIIGRFTDIKETDQGLFVKGHLIKGIQLADEAALLLKDGALDSMSIGFNVLDSERKNNTMILKEIDLFEISLVTFPANPMAVVTNVKSIFSDLPILKIEGSPDISKSWDADEAIKRVKEHTNSVDSPGENYKNAFLFLEGENLSDHKLLIADVIDGDMVVIPQAVFAAAAMISGARGGVELPDSAKNAVVTSINKYYAKMGMDSPFNRNGGLVINSKQAELITNKREFEKLLRDSGCFSKSAATLLAGNWSVRRDPAVEKSEVMINQANELNSLLDSIINNK